MRHVYKVIYKVKNTERQMRCYGLDKAAAMENCNMVLKKVGSSGRAVSAEQIP